MEVDNKKYAENLIKMHIFQILNYEAYSNDRYIYQPHRSGRI